MYRRKHLSSAQSDGIGYVSCPNSLFASCYILLIKFSLQYTFAHFGRSHKISPHPYGSRLFYVRARAIKYRKNIVAMSDVRYYSMARASKINRKCIKFPYWYSHLLKWGTISFAHIKIRGIFRPASNTIAIPNQIAYRDYRNSTV